MDKAKIPIVEDEIDNTNGTKFTIKFNIET